MAVAGGWRDEEGTVGALADCLKNSGGWVWCGVEGALMGDWSFRFDGTIRSLLSGELEEESGL